jgi:hypothetical protein
VVNMEKKRARKVKAAADRKSAEKPAAQLPTTAANDTAAALAPDLAAPPKRLSLAELRAAAIARRAAGASVAPRRR